MTEQLVMRVKVGHVQSGGQRIEVKDGSQHGRVLANLRSSTLKCMPWQEVPETLGNCRVFGRILYCGEKCWIERDSLRPSGENVSVSLPSRASRLQTPSPTPPPPPPPSVAHLYPFPA